MSGKQDTGRQVALKCLARLVALAAAAFWLMLCFGVVAREHGWSTLSYWDSVLITIGLGAVVQYGTVSIRSRDSS